jgi:hypothetical protein
MMLDRLTAPAGTWDQIWSWTGRILVINLGVTVANLPLLAGLALCATPWRWPIVFALLSLSVGPSLAAAFGCLDGSRYRTAYRKLFWPALWRWTGVVAGAGVLGADILWLHDKNPGALLVPMLAVLAVLLLSAGILSLALLTARPGTGLLLPFHAAVRHWWLSLISLAMFALCAVVVSQRPLLGLATLPGCAVIVAWHNSKSSLSPSPLLSREC